MCHRKRAARSVERPRASLLPRGYRRAWHRCRRSLLARGRATIKSKHHPVIARLFGGTIASRGSSKRSRPLGRFAGVPDPIFWTVMEYWRLGDWRRPGTLPDPDSEE